MNKERMLGIEEIENARHLIEPNRYRLIVAELLVKHFYNHTKSVTEIMNHTNLILEEKNIEPISRGFVRNIAEKLGANQ